MLGTVLRQMGRQDEALAEFRATLEHDADSAEAWISIGQVLQRQKDADGSARAFAEADRLRKKKADAQAATFAMSTGAQKLAAGDVDGAIAQLARGGPTRARQPAGPLPARARPRAGRPQRRGAGALRRGAPPVAASGCGPCPAVAARVAPARSPRASRCRRSSPAGPDRARRARSPSPSSPPGATPASTRSPSSAGTTRIATCSRRPARAWRCSTTTTTGGSTSSSSTAPRSRASPAARNRARISTGTAATARFEDVTAAAGLQEQWGWGQGACAGDYDNDGFEDLAVTYFGQNRLFHNTGTRPLRRRHRAGRPEGSEDALGHRLRVPRLRSRRPARSLRRQLHRPRSRHRADARLRPLPVQGRAGRVRSARAHRRPERPLPQRRRRTLRGRLRGLRHRPRQRDVRPRRHARSTSTTTGGSTCTWRTTRTRARSIATGTTAPSRTSRVKAGCAYSQDGKPQAGMGVSVGDYDRNGTMDIVKTNFAGDTSTLYGEHRRRLLRGPHLRERPRPEHPLARLGRRLRRFRQRRLARHLPHQRARLPGGAPAADRGRLRAAQGRLSRRQRPVRGRQRAARPAGHGAEGRARHRLRRHRQRRHRRRRHQQRPRHAGSVPHEGRPGQPLAARSGWSARRRTGAPSAPASAW